MPYMPISFLFFTNPESFHRLVAVGVGHTRGIFVTMAVSIAVKE